LREYDEDGKVVYEDGWHGYKISYSRETNHAYFFQPVFGKSIFDSIERNGSAQVSTGKW